MWRDVSWRPIIQALQEKRKNVNTGLLMNEDKGIRYELGKGGDKSSCVILLHLIVIESDSSKGSASAYARH